MAESLSETDIEYCLLALYRRGGSYNEAASYLKTTYLGDNAPDAQRLKRWRTGIHRDKYLRVAASNAEDLEKEIVVRLRELATQAGLLQLEGMEHLMTRIKSGDVTPNMIKELSIISGVSIDKLLVLSGRPDKIVEVQNPDLIIKRLVESGYADVIDATATDVTPQFDAHIRELDRGEDNDSNAHVRANQRSRTGKRKRAQQRGQAPESGNPPPVA